MIYLDYAANSPVEKEVLDLFYKTTLKYFANPNSIHKLGKEANKIIEKSTNNIAKNLKVLKEEIIYTSGASESNNLAIKGICNRYKTFGKHILISSLEHNSIMAPASVMQEDGFEVELIPINKEGLVDKEKLKQMIREDTILVSICASDSEIGIRQDIEGIAKMLKEYPNIHFHTDASQLIGKEDLDISNVDLVTITPHKFYGMNGFGLLIKKKDVSLVPIINGGRSTTVYRSGTPVLASIVALDKALEIALENQEDRTKYVSTLKEKIIKNLSQYKNIHINSTKKSIPYMINFSIKNINVKEFIDKLEENEIYVSQKTACCPTKTPSKLVYALTHDKNLASSSIRISLSHLIKEDKIEKFLEIFNKIIEGFDK